MKTLNIVAAVQQVMCVGSMQTALETFMIKYCRDISEKLQFRCIFGCILYIINESELGCSS